MSDRSSVVQITNDSLMVINPSTETKQDQIISALSVVSYDLLLDNTTTSDITYIWEASIWTATSAGSWRIKRLNETSWLNVGWADSNTNFDNIWDNRASLSYSK